MARSVLALVVWLIPAAVSAQAQQASPGLPAILPRAQEIALARSAAPPQVSAAATVFVLERGGFVKAETGTNGVTCLVDRTHPASLEPHCYDAEGSRTILPIRLAQAEMRERGLSKAEISAAVNEGIRRGRFTLPERAAMSYMMSSAQVLYNDAGRRVGAWKPHLMIYMPYIEPADLGVSGGRPTAFRWWMIPAGHSRASSSSSLWPSIRGSRLVTDTGMLAAAYVRTRAEPDFRALYREVTPRAYGLALRLSAGAADEAAEVVQEAWLRAVERLERYRVGEPFGPWLCGFVVRCWRELCRRRHRAAEVGFDEGLITAEAHVPCNWTIDPATLTSAVNALPAGFRDVLILHDVEGYTHAEIAGLLEVTVGTSKSQLSRARARLRHALAGPASPREVESGDVDPHGT